MIKGKVRFKVKTPLDITVRTTEKYWKLITEFKHPIIKIYEKEVKETLEEPDEIRRSKIDEKVLLYYRQYKSLENRYICVLIKRLNSKGFIVTAYLADKIKRGDVIWQKDQRKSW